VQGVGDGVLDRRSDAVEQFAAFVDGKWYQSGVGLVIDALFWGVSGRDEEGRGGHGHGDVPIP
jgi:hypothetical protein